MLKIDLTDFYAEPARVLEDAGPENLLFEFRNYWAQQVGTGEFEKGCRVIDPLRPYVESIFERQAEILFAEALADGRRFNELFKKFLWSFPDSRGRVDEAHVLSREEQLQLRDELYTLARKYEVEPTCEGPATFSSLWTLAKYSKKLEGR